MITSGMHEKRRKAQAIDWLHFLLVDSLKTWFYSHPDISSKLPDLSKEVENKTISAAAAAAQLLGILKDRK
jgi:LAO/AO transport system kinase